MPQACRSPAGGGSPGRAGGRRGEGGGWGRGRGESQISREASGSGRVCVRARPCACVCVCVGGGSASIMWLESRGELQLPLKGEEPRAGGGREPGRPAVAPSRCVHTVQAHVSGGGERPQVPGRARFGGSWPLYCARSAGARRDVTSGGRSRAGRGAEDRYNAAAGSAGPRGRGAPPRRARPLPLPALSSGYTWASGLGRAVFLWLSRIIEETGKISNVLRLRH